MEKDVDSYKRKWFEGKEYYEDDDYNKQLVLFYKIGK